MKNRTLFSLSFCLDTTASSAQVQKNEKINSRLKTFGDSPRRTYRPIHEKSDKQSLSNDIPKRRYFSVSLTPRIFLHPLFANRDKKTN